MKRIQGRIRHYAWGSREAIPRYFGLSSASLPIAEVWLGAHADAPAKVDVLPSSLLFDPLELDSFCPEESPHPTPLDLAHHRDNRTEFLRGGDYGSPVILPDAQKGAAPTVFEGTVHENLRGYVASDPAGILGKDLARANGGELPYMVKIIAAAEPLSLQVHPSRLQAREGFSREEALGIARSSSQRLYKDANHKPELVYALSDFFGLAGFRAPRRIAAVVEDLGLDLTSRIRDIVMDSGVKAAFQFLLDPDTRPSQVEISQVVEACRIRIQGESPSLRADSTLIRLAQKYPDDPGVVASLLLNPVSLRPGEALFIPSRTIHAYMEGLAVEIMASSDNVLRAGLTEKHVDAAELLRVISPEAAPPVRIAPERMSTVASTFYAPVDDFELTVMRLKDANEWMRVPARSGPRTVLCLEGAVQVESHPRSALGAGQRMSIDRGQAVFAGDNDGDLSLRGFGRIVIASVP